MAMSDGSVRPNPGIPKTLGILNVIFSVLLVLAGLCTVTSLAAGPVMMVQMEKIAKSAQEEMDKQNKAAVKGYDDRIAAAKTDEERKQVEQEKAATIAAQPKMNPVDFTAAMGVYKDPKSMLVQYIAALSGLLLHVTLLVAGIGLIRLTGWGRALSLWWAGLQVVQVLAVLAGNILFVLPVSRAMVENMAQAQAAGPAGPGTAQIMQMSAAMAVPMVVGTAIAGLVYPIVVLILLNRPAARAACLAKQSDGYERY